ncbi:MAG: hypothetical protein AAF204_00510 [Pseudomonadota bacterium]
MQDPDGLIEKDLNRVRIRKKLGELAVSEDTSNLACIKILHIADEHPDYLDDVAEALLTRLEKVGDAIPVVNAVCSTGINDVAFFAKVTNQMFTLIRNGLENLSEKSFQNLYQGWKILRANIYEPKTLAERLNSHQVASQDEAFKVVSAAADGLRKVVMEYFDMAPELQFPLSKIFAHAHDHVNDGLRQAQQLYFELEQPEEHKRIIETDPLIAEASQITSELG